jgi:hypothetical protein
VRGCIIINIWNATGDVWKKVGSSGTFNGRITWLPYKSWTDEEGNGFTVDGTTYKARARLTAWPLDNPPDYMVLDITEAGAPGLQRYYESPDSQSAASWKAPYLLVHTLTSTGVFAIITDEKCIDFLKLCL